MDVRVGATVCVCWLGLLSAVVCVVCVVCVVVCVCVIVCAYVWFVMLICGCV